MKKVLMFVITVILLLNYHLPCWAETSEKDSFYLEEQYKKNFIVNNTNLIFLVNETQNEKPNKNLLFWGLVLPGTGQLAIGESFWGTLFLTLALIPFAFMAYVFISLIGSNDDGLGKGFALLFSGIISGVFYIVVYIMNVINIFTLATSHNKDEDKEIKSYYHENIVESIKLKDQSLVYNFNF